MCQVKLSPANISVFRRLTMTMELSHLGMLTLSPVSISCLLFGNPETDSQSRFFSSSFHIY